MDFSKMLQNLGQSASGNISKCILLVRNMSPEVEMQEMDALAAVPNQGNDQDGKPIPKNIQDVIKLNDQLMALAQKTLKGGKTASFKEVASAAKANHYFALEMQYNPTSLRFDTTAGRQVEYSGGAGAPEVQQYTTPAATTLSCELLFNDLNNMDAFMLGDNPVTGLTFSNVKNAVSSAFVKKDYSVLRQMEGLLSLLTLPEARNVIFFWGAMSFRGEMTGVSTRYTMFNKKGYPIRGTLGIQIRQGDSSTSDSNPDQAFHYDDKYWMESFDATFTTQGPGADKWRQALSNSVLNLKL